MNKPSTLVPMRSTAVNFTYGMIVNDTDLTAAMHYPVQLMQAVNRAVYGCGVVCGFRFDPDPDICHQTVDCDPCDDQDTRKAYRGFKVQVGRGTAIDCTGLPIELCEPAIVDVSPDICGCKDKDGEDGPWVCIAIRRATATEAPRGDCCGDGGAMNCTRTRDHVEIRAFAPEKVPDHTCRHWTDGKPSGDCGCGCGGSDGTAAGQDGSAPMDPCTCLLQCDPCDCCGEGWVLLGCVRLCKAGVLTENFRQPNADGGFGPYPREPYRDRRMIKLIDCLCRGKQMKTEAQMQVSVEDRDKLVVEELKKAKIDLTPRQLQSAQGLIRIQPQGLEAQFKEHPAVLMNMLNLTSEKKSREVVKVLSSILKE